MFWNSVLNLSNEILFHLNVSLNILTKINNIFDSSGKKVKINKNKNFC